MVERGGRGAQAGKGLVVLLLVVLVAALGWTCWQGADGLDTADTDAGTADTDAVIPDAVPAGPPVTVSGRILLEVPAEPAEPEPATAVVVVGADTAHVAEADEGDTQGEPEPDPDAPPVVTLEPPTAGTCLIVARRDGEVLGEPATCDAEGKFEVILPPSGRAAFELEVPGRLRAVVEVDLPDSGRARLPTVALGMGQTVRGQVVDGRGTSMPGAQVQAMPIPNLGEPEPWRSTTDDAGAFSFDTLPPGPVAMRVAPAGYDPSVVETIAPADDVLVTVAALIDLRGSVVGPPALVRGAHVRLEGSGIWPALDVAVDAKGRFSFERIPDGVYALQAFVVSDEGPELASIPLENVTPDLEATLALIPARRVPVDVVGPKGDPIAGARVSIGNAQVGLLAQVAKTDDQGRAMVGPLVPGDYVARADADDHLPSAPVEVRVDPEVPVIDPVVLTLLAPGRIAGLVVDEGGRGVEGAVVLVDGDALFTVGESQARAEVFSGNLVASGSLGVTRGPVPEIPTFDEAGTLGEVARDVRQVVSDADGRFVLAGLSPGRYTLQAVDGRFAASARVDVDIAAGTVVGGIRLVLRRGWPLTGRVRDGNGRPVRGATVELGDGTAYRTDGRGVFDAGRRQGAQSLLTRADGKAPQRRDVRVRGPTDVEIVLADATGRLDGRVEDGNGQPIEDARVTLDFEDGLSASVVAWTDVRGVWELHGLPAGPAMIEIVAPGLLAEERRVVVAADETRRVDVGLVAGWAVQVEVRETGRRDPIAGAMVTADGRRAATGNDGVATLDLLSGDAVTVRVEAPGFASASVAVDAPTGGADRTSVRVELTEGGEIRGRVTDYRGDPVPRSTVMVRRGATVLGQVQTDATGRWSVEGIPEGDVEIDAYPPPDREDELAEVAQDSDVLRGRVTADVDLRFDRR